MQTINDSLNRVMSNMNYRSELVRQYVCPGCHNAVNIFRLTDLKGNAFERSFGCDCELLNAIKIKQQQVNQQRIDRIFNQYSLVNKSLLSANFESFKAYSQDLVEALQQAQNFAAEFNKENGKNLLLQSTGFGTGKSHLSMSIIKTVKQKGYTTIFTSTPKLLTKIRSTYNRNTETSEDKMINNIAAADLVVFDDIGAENAKGWGHEKLFEIIDQRSGKSNIFTTNLNSNDFQIDRDLGRLFSRMMDNCTVISLNDVPDYRMKNFKRKINLEK